MSWNYRIMRDKDGFYGIREVYYNARDGSIDLWTKEDMAPGGESVKELRSDFLGMFFALLKPVLDEKELDKDEHLPGGSDEGQEGSEL